jgi:hypothetical protein
MIPGFVASAGHGRAAALRCAARYRRRGDPVRRLESIGGIGAAVWPVIALASSLRQPTRGAILIPIVHRFRPDRRAARSSGASRREPNRARVAVDRRPKGT